MKKGETYEGVCLKTVFPCKGIVGTDEGNVIVKGALPGQRVSFRINKNKHGIVEGALTGVLEKSAEEKAEAEKRKICPHFGICGGCSYISLPYEAELKIKEEQMLDLFTPVLKQCGDEISDKWQGIFVSPLPFEYRNKMEFSFGDEYKDGPLALGMHRKGSLYDIVTVDECMIVDEDYRAVIRATLDFFKSKDIPFYHKSRCEGYLRHLLVRKAHATGEMLTALVTSSQAPDSEKQLLKEYAEVVKNAAPHTGVIHIVNDSQADVVKADRIEILYGRDYINERLLGLGFKISLFSFFQTNTVGAEVLYSKVREYVSLAAEAAKTEGFGEVYDLYCGTGTITQLVASVAEHVTGVEIVEEAVEAAKENAVLNGIDNVSFIAGDVLKVLDDLNERPGLIILDPPRDGVHPKALPKILSYDSKYLIYVSCKPTSLARDLVPVYEAGYRVVKMCCVDQFPWTSGAEVCCLLEQLKSAKEHIEITIDAEDYYRIKDSDKKQDE